MVRSGFQEDGWYVAACFDRQRSDEYGTDDIASTMSARDFKAATDLVAQPYSIMPMNSGKDYKARETDVSQPIMAAGPSGGNQGGDYVVQAITQFGEIAGTLSARHDSSPCADRGQNMVNQSMAVRRLTPRECERLQGFPDDYTAIPGAADGPRYKALGNSMAVPVMAWIGKRINLNVKTISADHPFDECPTETVKESE